eukprot:scaffold1019_cov338-Pavlova_lutheri.AAC.18
MDPFRFPSGSWTLPTLSKGRVGTRTSSGKKGKNSIGWTRSVSLRVRGPYQPFRRVGWEPERPRGRKGNRSWDGQGRKWKGKVVDADPQVACVARFPAHGDDGRRRCERHRSEGTCVEGCRKRWARRSLLSRAVERRAGPYVGSVRQTSA